MDDRTATRAPAPGENVMRKPTIRRPRRMNAHVGGRAEPEVVEIQASELGGLFAAPNWLRDLGVMAWLVAGVAIVVTAAIALLSATHTIVMPMVTAAIIAAVLSPVVRLLNKWGLPRAGGTVLVLLLVVLIGFGIGVLVMTGITSEGPALTSKLSAGVEKLEAWLQDAGVSASAAAQANASASNGVSSAFHRLLDGITSSLESLGSLVIFLTFTLLGLVFLLKDGPTIRNWTERHLGLPHDLARAATGRVLTSLRGYFGGVTAIAVFNGVVVGAGAWLLGVPLAGSIAVVTFVGAYIPYLGAWVAGAFAVLVALGGSGTEEAIAIAIICLLANGILQQLIQPIAFGATLGIHPLAVLIVTITGGSLFGMIGLVLAAPLTAAAVRIASDVARAKALEEQAAAADPAAPDPAAPDPAAPDPAFPGPAFPGPAFPET